GTLAMALPSERTAAADPNPCVDGNGKPIVTGATLATWCATGTNATSTCGQKACGDVNKAYDSYFNRGIGQSQTRNGYPATAKPCSGQTGGPCTSNAPDDDIFGKTFDPDKQVQGPYHPYVLGDPLTHNTASTTTYGAPAATVLSIATLPGFLLGNAS